MAQFQVLFELPEFIQNGLANGEFQRIGGVIIKSGTKQVVAWLRDSQILEQTREAESNTLFQMVLLAAQNAVTLADQQLADTTVAAADATPSIVQFSLSGQMLNLALTTATFRAMLYRLDRLSHEIEQLSNRVLAEFDRDRDMRFKIALEAARDVFDSESASTRDSAIRTAIDGLYEARENFLTDYRQTLSAAPDIPHLHLAQHFLIRALYAEISRIRCYIISDDLDLAKKRLSEDLPLFQQHTRELVQLWLGDQPAIYFHPDFAAAPELDRFLRIQQWLHGISQQNDPTVLFRVLNDMRGKFWNHDILEAEYASFLHRISGRPKMTLEERRLQLAENLTQAEHLIENYERLVGFDLEVRSLRLSFEQWSALAPEIDLDQHGIALIIDENALNMTQWE